MPIWPFRGSRADEDAERLLRAVTSASRQPGFFGEGRIADTLEGRFELMTMHACMALFRLRAEANSQQLAQLFVDKLFRAYDAGLREAATSDTAVPKRMAKIAAAFYGRAQAYEAALQDLQAMEAALLRNVFGGRSGGFARTLAEYAVALAARQAEAPLRALFAADGWSKA